jgi:tetratricopeptide (TPR) repeat protein
VADRNPYVIGVPLTNDAAFYGRQDVFNFVKDVLDAEKQNVIVLYGQRRIGKTSVLHKAAKWLENQGSFFPVYFDLQGKERLNLGEVLENLAHTLSRRLELAKPDAALFDDEGSYFGDRFLPLAFERLGESRLVLLVDEFDVLSDELESPRAASKTLFPYLQNLIVTRPQIGFVFVVGRRIEELSTHFQVIFKQAVYRRIGHLNLADSRALIVEPARGMITYSDEALQQIQSLAAGHPYFTQLICFEVFNTLRASGQTTVTANVVSNVVNSAIESGHGALNWFWEGLPRAERFILSAVAQVSDESGVGSKEAVRQLLEEHHIRFSGLELKDAPDRLVEWEMLRREGPDAYQFVVELVRRWVIKEHPLSSARRDIDYVSKRAVRLFENARDAHSEGDLPYARDEYRRTLKANPNHSGAQLGLALVLYELGEIDEAIVEFERAYVIDEMSARDGLMRARLAKGKALEKQDLIDNAISQYEQVLRLASGEETALRHLGSIWQRRAEESLSAGNLTAAGNAFRAMLLYDHSRETIARMQTALVAHVTKSEATGNVERGIAAYVLLAELIPDREDVRTLAIAFGLRSGEFLETSGRLDDAIVLYLKVIALFPGDVDISKKLDSAKKKVHHRETIDRIFEEALAARRSGNMDRARDGFKKLIQTDVLSYKGNNIATLLAETIGQTTPSAAANTKSQLKRPVENRQALMVATTRQLLHTGRRPSTRRLCHTKANPFTKELRVSGSWSKPMSPVPLFGGVFVPVVVVVSLALLLAFVTIPASIVRIDLPTSYEVRANATLQLSPKYFWDSDWRFGNCAQYFWNSSNKTVATVSAGTVTGVSPGTARIIVSCGAVSGSTKVTVSQWDIPPIRAYLAGIRFFASEGPVAPELGARHYDTRFDSRSSTHLWAELKIDTAETIPAQALKELVSYTIFRADGSSVDWKRVSQIVGAKSDYSIVRGGVWCIRLDKWRFPKRGFDPNTYHIVFKHGEKVIGEATIEVV